MWLHGAAVLLRFGLVQAGLGEPLVLHVAVSTPANGLLRVREAAYLSSWRVSAFDRGSSCHTPPVLLAVLAPFAHSRSLYAVPNIVCDLLASRALYSLSIALQKKISSPPSGHKEANFLGTLLLWNPLAIVTCISGSTTPVENAAIFLSIYAAVLKNVPLAAFGLACAGYISLHPYLLLVPLLLLIIRGPETLQQKDMHTGSKVATSSQAAAAADQEVIESNPNSQSMSSSPPNPVMAHNDKTRLGSAQQYRRPQVWRQGFWFLGFFVLWSCCLLVLSDVVLRRFPDNLCLMPLIYKWQQHSKGTLQQSQCWFHNVYGFILKADDLTPNIGLFWYFFTELFDNFRAFFLFVFHSHSVVMLVPLAVVLHRRPLFLIFCQLVINAMFKPYPSAGDLVPYLTLLPLFQEQLGAMRHGLFFVNSFVLLLVLGPAMWHQWIVMDAANSNFFYSITLLFGLWQTVFLTHMITLTLRVDRILKMRRMD